MSLLPSNVWSKTARLAGVLWLVTASVEPAAARDAAAPGPAPVPATEGSGPPRRIDDRLVEYPESAKGSARVELELVVDEHGRVDAVRAVSGGEPFLSTAVEFARELRFDPARVAGEPRRARIRFTVEFVPPKPDESRPTARVGPTPSPPGEASMRAVSPDFETPEVTVLGARPRPEPRLSSEETRQLPGAFGDPFRAVEALPGVTPIASGAPYFFVRGAPPGNVGYYFDGIRVPALFHAFAGPSVIPSGLVQDVTLYPAAYPPRFGGFVGGIVAAEAKPPSPKLRGEAAIRAVDSSALLEAPVASGRGHLTLGGRYSYTKPIVSLVEPDLEVSYWDYQVRTAYATSPRSRLSVLSFGSKDFAAQRQSSGRLRTLYDVSFHRVDLRHDSAVGETGRWRTAATLGLDRSGSFEAGFALESRSAGLSTDVELSLSDTTRLHAGARIELTDLKASFADDLEDRDEFLEGLALTSKNRQDLVTAAHAELTLEPERGIRVAPGLRLELYESEGHVRGAVSPSVRADFGVTSFLSLHQAFGVSHQPPSFSFPLPGAAPALAGGLQTALQHSAGASFVLPEHFFLSLTLYQNAVVNLSDALGVSRLDNEVESITAATRGIGSSRGLELLLRRSFSRRLGGFVSYTLSRSERFIERAAGPSTFDRTHVFSGALSYRMGRGWRAGARLVFYTGIPGDVAYLAAARNPPRSPPFARLDLRLEKKWRLDESGASLSLVAEALNATLNREVLNRRCNAHACRDDVIGPVTIPSLGLEGAF